MIRGGWAMPFIYDELLFICPYHQISLTVLNHTKAIFQLRVEMEGKKWQCWSSRILWPCCIYYKLMWSFWFKCKSLSFRVWSEGFRTGSWMLANLGQGTFNVEEGSNLLSTYVLKWYSPEGAVSWEYSEHVIWLQDSRELSFCFAKIVHCVSGFSINKSLDFTLEWKVPPGCGFHWHDSDLPLSSCSRSL